MSLILRGKEFISADALSAGVLAGLSALAAGRPLLINGVRLDARELAALAEEARRDGRAVRVGQHPAPAGR